MVLAKSAAVLAVSMSDGRDLENQAELQSLTAFFVSLETLDVIKGLIDKLVLCVS